MMSAAIISVLSPTDSAEHHSLFYRLPLELSEYGEDPDHGPAERGRRVEILGHTDKVGIVL